MVKSKIRKTAGNSGRRKRDQGQEREESATRLRIPYPQADRLTASWQKEVPSDGGDIQRKKRKAGGGLLSRLWAVSSAQGRLTSVFGTGTGISAPPWPPA